MNDDRSVSLERVFVQHSLHLLTSFFQILPHAYQDSPYVDILGWLEDQHARKKAKENEDHVIRIVKIRMSQELKKLKADFKGCVTSLITADKRRVASLNADYKGCVAFLNDQVNKRHENQTTRIKIIHRVIKAARKAQSNPILPEHEDPLKKRDNYL
jgi:2-succinyl-5-enolpyruvyl-6-hydroxy-3-cyclohexene-1-carboxylate synthase